MFALSPLFWVLKISWRCALKWQCRNRNRNKLRIVWLNFRFSIFCQVCHACNYMVYTNKYLNGMDMNKGERFVWEKNRICKILINCTVKLAQNCFLSSLWLRAVPDSTELWVNAIQEIFFICKHYWWTFSEKNNTVKYDWICQIIRILMVSDSLTLTLPSHGSSSD